LSGACTIRMDINGGMIPYMIKALTFITTLLWLLCQQAAANVSMMHSGGANSLDLGLSSGAGASRAVAQHSNINTSTLVGAVVTDVEPRAEPLSPCHEATVDPMPAVDAESVSISESYSASCCGDDCNCSITGCHVFFMSVSLVGSGAISGFMHSEHLFLPYSASFTLPYRPPILA